MPDTDAGREARKWLEQSAVEPPGFLAEEERTARRTPKNITLLQSIRGLERLEVALAFVLVRMKVTASRIEMFVPELKKPFEKADSCKELDALGED